LQGRAVAAFGLERAVAGGFAQPRRGDPCDTAASNPDSGIAICSLTPNQRPGRGLHMAGFQVIIYGRFWVFTEVDSFNPAGAQL